MHAAWLFWSDDPRTGAAITIFSHNDQSHSFKQSELIALIPQMRAFARSLCRDLTEADDLTQDTLVSAWRGRERYTPSSHLKAWVYKIMRNQFYSGKRRSWRVSQLDPRVAEETLVTVSNPTSSLELDDVRRAMQELADEQREALTLVAVAGLSYQEAATICGCPIGTMKSRVSRARNRLTELLTGGDLVAEPRTPGLAMAAIVVSAERYQQRTRHGARSEKVGTAFSIGTRSNFRESSTTQRSGDSA